MRAQVLRSPEALAAIEDSWRDLWLRGPGSTPFQSPAWLLSWWTCFAPGELRVIAIFDDQRLVALAPLYLEDGVYGRRLLPIGISLSDYTDVLIDPGVPDARSAFLQALRDVEGWDALALDDAPAWSTLRDHGTEPSHCAPVLAIGPARWDEHVPARKRRQWRRACRAAQARGGFEIEAVTNDLDLFLDELFELHEARWRTRGEDGVLRDERVRRFHRQVAPRLVAEGLARFYRLRIGDELAGVYYGMRQGARAFAYIGGFDPRFDAESPGSILIGHALERAYDEGARELHFLRGEERYKFDWGAQAHWNQRVIVRNDSHALA